MAADHYLIGVLLLAVPGMLFLLVGSPVRILLVVFAMQIVLTISQLNILITGIPSIRADDLLTLWLVCLWILSLPDRSMKGIRIGLQGKFIVLFLIVFGIAAYRGFAAGQSTFSLINQLKTYGAYFLYFPLLWILSDRESCKLIWNVLLASAVIGGLIYLIKGFSGTGEDVYIRDTTGLRIATRQPNAIGAVLMVFLGKLWKNWKERPPLIIIVPAIILMGAGIILSQIRGLWGGVILALAAAWILNLFRKKDNVKLGKKLVISLTVISVLVILVVFTISTLGILSASNIARRTGTESGSYLTDISTLSRIVAWSAIIDDLRGSGIIIGNGLGDEYTCFRPDIGGVITVYYTDSSYFQIALNMGIIGVIVFLGIFVVTLFRAAKLFIITDSRRRAGTALGIFCAVIMLLFASGFASVMTNYRFTMLWAFLPALLQAEIMKDKKDSILISSECSGK